MNFINHKLRYT